MKQANDIIKELKEMGSPLADMSRTTPYEIPQGYFEGFESSLLAGVISADTIPSFSNKQLPYEAPAGYFDTLPQQILLAALESDTVADMTKTMPYETPKGYFDELPQQVLNSIKTSETPVTPKTRVITLNKAIRWAAAAILISGIGITSYRMLQPDDQSMNTEQAIAALPNNMISDYVQQQKLTVAYPELNTGQAVASNIKELDKLKEEDIVNYLDETGWDESL